MSEREAHQLHGHVSHAVLMLHLDGELGGEDEAAVTKHLHECWECRERLEWVKQGVLTFLDYYRQVLVPGLPAIGDATSLPPVLRQAATLPMEDRSFGGRRKKLFGMMARIPVRAWVTTAASVSLLIALPYLWVVAPARLTASEFLRRVSTAAARDMNSAKVRRVRIRRGTQVFEREVAGAGLHKASLKKPDTGTLAALRVVKLNWEDPLNPGDFAQWHQSLADAQDSIRESQSDITLETTLPEDSAVRFVSFTVSRADWHPTNHHIEFRGEPAIDIDELPDAPPEAEAGNSPSVKPPAAPKEEPAGPTAEELEDAEVRLREALHGLQADLYAAPVIRRVPGQVSLMAFAPSDGDRARILEALRDIPYISTRIVTPEEAAAEQRGEASAPKSAAQPLQTARAPLADSLRKYCGGLEEANSYLAVLAESHSETLMAASALKNLADRYTAADWNRLSPDLRARLGRLIDDYLTRLSRSAHAYDALASPLLDSVMREMAVPVASERPAPECCLSWQEESSGVAEQVQQMQSILTALFAEAGKAETGSSERDRLADRLTECDRARSELKRLLRSAGPPISETFRTP
jgi:hypothetical protein